MRNTCLNMVHELARRDPRVVFVGSDLSPGLLNGMRAEMPERWFMEGVAEQNVIGLSAGLAFEGFMPYVNTIATFLTRRCYEQVAVDLCLHRLPVRLIANGGGLVYAPLGPTHLAIEDIAIMRALPHMTVVCPTDAEEMKRFMLKTLGWPDPIYIRLAKGGDPVVSRPEDGFEIGRAILLRKPQQVLIVATGVTVNRALKATEALSADKIHCGVLNMHTVKPLDRESLFNHAKTVDLVVTVEEHTLIGGLGSAVADAFLEAMGSRRMPGLLRLGIPDEFPHEYGSQDSLMEAFGLQPAQIAASIRGAIRGETLPNLKAV